MDALDVIAENVQRLLRKERVMAEMRTKSRLVQLPHVYARVEYQCLVKSDHEFYLTYQALPNDETSFSPSTPKKPYYFKTPSDAPRPCRVRISMLNEFYFLQQGILKFHSRQERILNLNSFNA